MRRRIVIVMILTTAVALVVILIPALFALRAAAAHEQEIELQHEAFTAVKQFEAVGTVAQLEEHFISAYLPDGTLLDGDGPTELDEVTRQALAGTPGLATAGDYVIAAVPLSNGGALRISEELAESERSALIGVAWLCAAALAIASLSYIAASRLSRTLSNPLGELAVSAGRLGADDANDARPRSGIAEVDRIADALRSSTARVSTLLHRERRLTSYNAHQLRTPLTGMRLAVEAEIAHPRDDRAELLNELLQALDRLEMASDSLIATYRMPPNRHENTEVVELVHAAVSRWRNTFELSGRAISTTSSGHLIARTRPGTVDTVLDVLIENALHHGAGKVRLDVDGTRDSVLIGVLDEGAFDDAAPEAALFSMQPLDTHGIGLTLARTLAEAEGGDIVLTSRHPTKFSFIVPCPADDTPAEATAAP